MPLAGRCPKGEGGRVTDGGTAPPRHCRGHCPCGTAMGGTAVDGTAMNGTASSTALSTARVGGTAHVWHCQSTARRGTARGGKHTSWETRKKGHCPWCRGTAHEDEALPHWWGTFPSKVTAWEGVSARGGVEGENSRARNGRDVSRAGGDGCRAPVERARRYMCRTSDCGPGLGLRAQTWQREIARGAGGSPRHGFVLWRRSAHPRNRNHAEQTKSIEWSCPKASSRPRMSKGAHDRRYK